MADKSDAHGAAVEEVAYRLLVHVANAEGKKLNSPGQPGEKDFLDRAYILNTFCECLEAAKGRRDWH